MSDEDDENFEKSEFIQGEGNLTYIREARKLLPKNITKKMFHFFAS